MKGATKASFTVVLEKQEFIGKLEKINRAVVSSVNLHVEAHDLLNFRNKTNGISPNSKYQDCILICLAFMFFKSQQ